MHSKRLFYIFLLPVILVSGCKKQVEVDAPATKLVSGSVFKDSYTATAAMLSLYVQMRNDPWFLHQMTALSADEFMSYATDPTSRDLYSNALNANTDATTIGFWSLYYNYIYQVNAVIEGLDVSTS